MSRKVSALPFQDAPPGTCRICGTIVLTKDGKPHKGRKWCDEHQLEAKVIGQPTRARAALFQRDLGVCKGCGEDTTSYRAALGKHPIWRGDFYFVQINRERALEWCDKALAASNRIPIWQIDLGQWEADHQYPLWLVDRTDPEAWRYWAMQNLITLCKSCHAEKTAKEAGTRGKVKRCG